MGSTHLFVEKSYFREVVEFEKEKFDSQQHLMEEAPGIHLKTLSMVKHTCFVESDEMWRNFLYVVFYFWGFFPRCLRGRAPSTWGKVLVNENIPKY